MSGATPVPPVEPSPPRRTGRLLGGLLLVVLGGAWLLESLDVVEVPWDALLPGVLIAVGVILVVNARTGASQGGLIALGVVLAVLAFLTAAIEFPFGGGVGERTEAPTTLAQADEGFELGIGQLTVDLSELAGAGNGRTVVRARVGVGQLVVLVPAGMPVRVEGKAGLGNVRVFELEEGGIDIDLTTEPPDGAAPVLDLRLSVGIGEVRVERG